MPACGYGTKCSYGYQPCSRIILTTVDFFFPSAKKSIRATNGVLERDARNSMHFTKVAEKTPKKTSF
jgi:hypothetical protein